MLTHYGTIELRTERLVLRKFAEDDAQAMFDTWTSDERVAKYTTWDAHKSVTETKEFVDYIRSKNTISDYNWIIELETKVIGNINVCCEDDEHETCGIAYCLGFDYWGKGYMTEAAKAVVDFLFMRVNYQKIIAGCDCANIGSSKIMEHIGMKLDTILKEQIKRKDGSLGDDAQYVILKKEYVEKQA